jgi:hypothetical protein
MRRVTKPSKSLRWVADEKPVGLPFMYRAGVYVKKECPWSHESHVDNCLFCAPFWGFQLWRLT